MSFFTDEEIADVQRPLAWWERVMLFFIHTHHTYDGKYVTQFKVGWNGKIYILYYAMWKDQHQGLLKRIIMREP